MVAIAVGVGFVAGNSGHIGTFYCVDRNGLVNWRAIGVCSGPQGGGRGGPHMRERPDGFSTARRSLGVFGSIGGFLAGNRLSFGSALPNRW